MKHIEAAYLMMFMITLIDIIIEIAKASEPQLPEQVTNTARLPCLPLLCLEVISWPLFCNIEAMFSCIPIGVPQAWVNYKSMSGL